MIRKTRVGKSGEELVMQRPRLSSDADAEELVHTLISAMATLNSSYGFDQPMNINDQGTTDVWLVEWSVSSAASSDLENRILTAHMWRHTIGNVFSWISGSRTTHWAIEIRDFRYELQRYGYWPFFWHGYIQVERKEARKRKPTRRNRIGRTDLNDLAIWAIARQTAKHCRVYTQLWDNCQQIMLDHFLPQIAEDAASWSKTPRFSRLIRDFVMTSYITHLLPFLAKEYGFWRTDRWRPPSPIASLFGTELLLLVLTMHPSKMLVSFRLPKSELYRKSIKLFIGWCAVCSIYFYYRMAISLYGHALCWIESTAPPPYALSFLPKAKVWALFRKPLEEEDRLLSLFLPIISSCKVYWWVCQFGMTLQVIVVASLVLVQVGYLLFKEVDSPICYQFILHGCRIDVACGLWEAFRVTLGAFCREFGIVKTGILGPEQEYLDFQVLGAALPQGQEDRQRVIFVCS